MGEKGKNKFISVILPTYNRAEKIVTSIESVLSQTYKFFELIIVDDASTDNTEKIVANINDSRIKYIKLERNSGPAVARNRGIESAQYDLIAFEDSDDFWLPDKLECQINKMKENEDYAIVYCAYDYLKDGYKINRIPSNELDRSELEGYIFDSLWKGNKIGTPTIMIRKQCIQELGGFCEKLHGLEDWEFVLRMATKYKIGFINKSLVKAHYSPMGVNSNESEQIKTIIYLISLYKDRGVVLKNMKRSLLFHLNRLNAEQLNMWKERIMLLSSCSEDDFNLALEMAKNERKYLLMIRIMERISKDDILMIFLKSYINFSIDKIAIYGAGNLGMVLARQMKRMAIDVECLIDQKDIESDEFVMCRPSQIPSSITKLIITIGETYDANYFKEIVNQKVSLINIFEILY